MARARAIPLTPTSVIFFLSFPLLLALAQQAHARTPAAIDYAGAAAPAQTAALARTARGPLSFYDYGASAAPASGPTLDLRGAFADKLAVAPRAAEPPAPPAAVSEGPLDIRPPAIAPAEIPLAAPAPGAYLVQIGAFAVRANAERSSARTAGLGGVSIDTVERPSGVLYRVRLGPWPSRAAAESARAAATELGFADARVTQAD